MKKSEKIGPIRKSIGFIFIVLGVLGIILPIAPGWIFLIMAIPVLGWPYIKEEISSLRQQIEKNKLEKRSSYFLKIYLIPLEWMLLLEQKKIKETVEDMKK